MPQLDPTSFSPQLFWLAIAFVLLYLLMSRLVLPRVAKVLGQREERIQGNLEKAEKLKAEADEVLAAYQKAIADARAEAHTALAKAAADIAATVSAREAEFGKKLAEQAAIAESRIKASKTQALAEVRTIAGDIAAAMTSKLTGLSVSTADAAGSVEAVLKERG
jgi:F-type H+-transporting ATPase subunit b